MQAAAKWLESRAHALRTDEPISTTWDMAYDGCNAVLRECLEGTRMSKTSNPSPNVQIRRFFIMAS